MKLHQLRYLNEVIRRDFNISRAAAALHTSQSGISKQILLLEEEIGVEILVRGGNRITGLTATGAEVAAIARNILDQTENILRVGQDFHGPETGSLVVATNHTHARYVLPKVLKAFAKRYPNVSFKVRQGTPAQIVALVAEGDADVGIGTPPAQVPGDVALLPCYELKHCLIAPKRHPLLKRKSPTLAQIAAYPIISYDVTHQVGLRILEKFRAANLVPRFIMQAIDSDVMKAYVAANLGVAIIPSIAYQPRQDPLLGARDLGELIEPSTTYIALRNRNYLRGYIYDFIGLLSPALTRERVAKALNSKQDSRTGK